MRTLYVRIIVITMVIMIASAILAFIVSNVYYQTILKPKNDEKVTHIAKNTVDIFEESHKQPMDSYLTGMADLGYQYYLVSPDGAETSFGNDFRVGNLSSETAQDVIDGEVYHGIRDFPWKPFVTGFFENDLTNTVGVPIENDGKTYALFVRQNTGGQFGEMRIFLAVMILLMLVISFLLVLTSTRFIVKPIKRLTAATRKIADGNYHVKLRTNRRDEFGRLATDFQKMSSSLALTEEKRQEFVSNVSHEIQSPLTSIQGFSKALQEEDMSKDERDHYLSIIEKESTRLSKLSKQLLTLSFLDTETDNEEAVTYDVAEQLKEVVMTSEWQWRDKDLAMELDLAQTYITADPKLMQQVWMNLVTNAIHYTEQGGTIRLRTKKQAGYVNVFVEDTGVGIDEADSASLFERFYKVDKARTRTDQSTGLGLSIVKRIVEMHDGTITVDSMPGKGSAFCVSLPKDQW